MQEWNNLVEHIEEHYYKPDILALKTALAVGTAHHFPQDEPIWLMVIGPPGCLAGDTKIAYQAWGENGRKTSKQLSLKTLYKRFHKLPYRGQGGRTVDKELRTGSIDETGRVFFNKIEDIVYSGQKECFLVTLESGQQIKATADHKFYIGGGYAKLSDLNSGSIVYIHNNTIIKHGRQPRPNRNYLYVNHHPVAGSKSTNGGCKDRVYTYKRVAKARAVMEAYINGLTLPEFVARLNSGDTEDLQFLTRDHQVHHLDENVTNDVIENLEILTLKEHARKHGNERCSIFYTVMPNKIQSIESVGVIDTYDICMKLPYNNFIANGIVVHNSGKTSVVIGSVLSMPGTYHIDTLTPNTFLSGFSKGGANGNCSLLNSIGTEDDRSGIFAMAEFSSFLGLREDNRREIASQMRRIYDGYLDRATGVGWLTWAGKITFIVAATSGAERTWNTMKDLGERFMAVRWAREDGVEQAKSAQRQIGHKNDIEARTRELVHAIVGVGAFPRIRPDTLTNEEIDYKGIAYLSEIVALSRAKVERDRSWKREIVDEPEPEGPTRIMKALCQVAMGSAALMRRGRVDESDFLVSKRLAIDSIPPARWKVINTLRRNADALCGFAHLVRVTGMAPSTLNWTLEDLSALGIIYPQQEDVVEKTAQLTENFRVLLTGAKPMIG